jgi:hypothetical protein
MSPISQHGSEQVEIDDVVLKHSKSVVGSPPERVEDCSAEERRVAQVWVGAVADALSFCETRREKRA